jgi:hypothetical protein
MAKLDPHRRKVLTDAFLRVGRQLLASAERVVVEPGCARRTWPRWALPAAVLSATRGPPNTSWTTRISMACSWSTEWSRILRAVFRSTTRGGATSECRVRWRGADLRRIQLLRRHDAVALNAYSYAETRRMVAKHGHPGAWNASWMPTAAHLEATQPPSVLVRKPGRSLR